MAILDRFRTAWNAFRNVDTPIESQYFPATAVTYGSNPPYKTKKLPGAERTTLNTIYTKLSVDVAALLIKHVKVDKDGRYLDDIDSSLNDCLMFEPNLDQSPTAFRQDIALTLFDKGCMAIVPVDTSENPDTNLIFDIYTMRVGEIVSYLPKHIRVSVYNEKLGKRQEITLEKRYVAIVENPLYPIMNEPNSTLQRLIRKINLLDNVDEISSSGKLDVIIQLPYVIKSEARRVAAEQRRADIEFQLRGSEYGIAYIDGTEKVTQLNRPAENNLLKQIEYLTKLFYDQLGLTDAVMNGTADEAAMINYFNRTVRPVVVAIVESMRRSFLGHAKIRKEEDIMFFRDPFSLVPVSQVAEIADKFVRNEVLTTNEIRQFMGIQPSKEPKADQLMNPNMPQPAQEAAPASTAEDDAAIDDALSSLDSELTSILNEFGSSNGTG